MSQGSSFEDGFVAFQERLRALETTSPLLWRLRDSIYNDLRYSRFGHDEARRHRFGKLSWVVWLVQQVVRTRRFPPQQRVRGQTQFGFLFYGSQDAHFSTLLPIVKELARRETVTIWCMALEEEQLSALKEIGNVVCVGIESWSKYAGWLPFRTALSNAKEAMRLQKLLASDPGLTPEDQNEARKKNSRITESFFEYFRWKRIWSDAFPTLPATALFLTSETSPMAKALRDVLRDANRRVIHLLHGLPNTTHEVTYVTDLCVYSASQQQWFQNQVSKEVHIRTIGNPRLEQIRAAVTPPRERNPRDPFRITYFSQVPGSYYDRAARCEDFAIMAAPNPEDLPFALRVRPHPAESIDALRQDLDSVGVKSYDISNGSLLEDLSWCDVAATTFSTALLEAAVCGRLCYWMSSGEPVFRAISDLCAHGVGKRIQNANDWRNELRAIADLQAAAPALVSEQRLLTLKILPSKYETWSERLGLEPDVTHSPNR